MSMEMIDGVWTLQLNVFCQDCTCSGNFTFMPKTV